MIPLPPALLILAQTVLIVFCLYKLRNMHLLLFATRDQLRTDNSALFRQMEALQGLYVDLGLKHSLPPTRGWAASPDFLMVLVRHALSDMPHMVVECSSGISTLVLARCMQLNGGGKVWSLEHDAHFAEQTRVQLERLGLSAFAQVLDAPLQAYGNRTGKWYRSGVLAADAKIDMLVIDGPPMASGALARYPAGPELFPLLAPGAAVFLDDANRPDETAILQRWQREFPHLRQSRRECEKGCAVLHAAP